MTDTAAAAPAAAAPAKKRSPLIWIVLALVVLMVAGGGAGASVFLRANPKRAAAEKKSEAPLPFTLAIKPYVISVPSGEGASHFIQLGANLQLPSSSAGDVINNVLPQVQDAM